MNFLIKYFSKLLEKIHFIISPSSFIREKNHHVIKYLHNGIEYKILYKHSRKRKIPINIEFENNDVSNEILPYIGPFHDFHGIQITPEDLGYKSLTFKFLKGEEKNFSEKQIIIF